MGRAFHRSIVESSRPALNENSYDRASPIFVIGVQHSGAAVAAWSLAQHPNIVPLVGSSWLGKLAQLADAIYDDALADLNSSHFISATTSRERFVSAFGQAADQLILENQAVSTAEDSWTSLRWVDATPGSAWYVASLLRAFPGAKCIHVVRDAHDVARTLLAEAPDHIHDEAQAYGHWLWGVKAGIEAEVAFGSNTVLRIRYGDLVDDSERTLRSCLQFVGEDWSSACLRPLRTMEGREIAETDQSLKASAEAEHQHEAEILSRLVLADPVPAYPRDERKIRRLERLEQTRKRSHREAPGNPPRLQAVVGATVPTGSVVAVVSNGDDELIRFDAHEGWHFPRTDDGANANYRPGDSDEAINCLEQVRSSGAGYFVIPENAFWWLDEYDGLLKHLETNYQIIAYSQDVCLVYSLSEKIEEGGRRIQVVERSTDSGNTGT
jgi:hypothetical protein